MTVALTLCAVLVALAVAIAGRVIGHRRGFRDGQTDSLRRLIAAKDQECWQAAHYIECDRAAEILSAAETKVIRKKANA